MNEYPNLEALADGRIETNARIGDYPLRSEAKVLLAEVEELRRELERHRNIRDLMVRSLCRATGATPEEITRAPQTIAIAHAKEVALLMKYPSNITERDKDLALDLLFGINTHPPRDCHSVMVAAGKIAKFREADVAARLREDLDWTQMRLLDAQSEIYRLRGDKDRLDWMEKHYGDFQLPNGKFVFPDSPTGVRDWIDARRAAVTGKETNNPC